MAGPCPPCPQRPHHAKSTAPSPDARPLCYVSELLSDPHGKAQKHNKYHSMPASSHKCEPGWYMKHAPKNRKCNYSFSDMHQKFFQFCLISNKRVKKNSKMKYFCLLKFPHLLGRMKECLCIV